MNPDAIASYFALLWHLRDVHGIPDREESRRRLDELHATAHRLLGTEPEPFDFGRGTAESLYCKNGS